MQKNAVRMPETQINQLEMPTVKARTMMVSVMSPLSATPNVRMATFLVGS
jgi:hypothetical protein